MVEVIAIDVIAISLSRGLCYHRLSQEILNGSEKSPPGCVDFLVLCTSHHLHENAFQRRTRIVVSLRKIEQSKLDGHVNVE